MKRELADPTLVEARRAATELHDRMIAAKRMLEVLGADVVGPAADHTAVLCAFDLIEVDGDDLRPLPIERRKDTLAKLLSRPNTPPSELLELSVFRSV